MSTSEMHLLGVCIIAFLVNIVETAISSSVCPVSPFSGRPPCNETCSRLSSFAGRRQFLCKIGYKIEWQDFSDRYGLDVVSIFKNSAEQLLTAPLLVGIALYPLPYRQNQGFSPTLNISFRIPFIGRSNSPETKAVLLKFGSPVSKNQTFNRFTDTAYSFQRKSDNSFDRDGRIYRLFDFSSYTPNSLDYQHHVVNNYPCLYGLDDCGYKKKIYTITLTSIAMNTSSYQKYFKCGPSNCWMSSLTYTVSVVPELEINV
ncbi:uncharacterized protein LOC134715743 [Mytilus trossulus]|uniref:uncharacterized protein LOC134715743 n=1 Tax=Mytilus trossulus TaxID=6551 RepID=UPI003007EB1E